MSDLSFLFPALSLGIAIGLLVYVFVLRAQHRQTLLSLTEETALLNALREERDQAILNATRLEVELDSERKQVQSRIESLNEAKEALTNQFKNLANEILEDKARKFTEQNAQQLDVLLKPLQTKLSEFKEQVSNSYEKE